MLTTDPQRTIEQWILVAKQNRTDKPTDGEIYGEELYDNTKADLQFLRQAWGIQSTQYQLLANKVAEEIRQCVHDFFMELRDSDEYDPGTEALRIAKIARLVGPTGHYKGRVDEMIESLEEWVEEGPERTKHKQLKEPIEFISNKLEKFQHQADSIENAKTLITSCLPKLNAIKDIVGRADDLYLQRSSGVAGNAMGMLVSFINGENEGLQYNQSKLLTFGQFTTAALAVQKMLLSFDLTNDVRKRVQENLTGLRSIHTPFVTLKRQQLSTAQTEMNKITRWQFGRSQEEREQQIRNQNAILNRLRQELKNLEDALS